MNKVVHTNNNELIIVNNKACWGLITPAGISRFAVRGLISSNFLSKYRLNDIAALLAKTIHNNIFTSNIQLNSEYATELLCNAINPKVNPIKAKGNAKMV